MQGGGMDPPSVLSVHFAWKWALRNSAIVRVCIDVSPSPGTGLSSRGPTSTSVVFGLSGAGDPVPVSHTPSSTRMPSKEEFNHSPSSPAVSLPLCILRTCIVNVILP